MVWTDYPVRAWLPCAAIMMLCKCLALDLARPCWDVFLHVLCCF